LNNLSTTPTNGDISFLFLPKKGIHLCFERILQKKYK
jgi:hypothetical protein